MVLLDRVKNMSKRLKILLIIVVLIVVASLPIIPKQIATAEIIPCASEESDRETWNGGLPYVPICYKQSKIFVNTFDYFIKWNNISL